MEHRWGLGTRVGRRAAAGAGAALALLLLRAGAALADSPAPSAPTPGGDVPAAEAVVPDLPPLAIWPDPSGGPVATDALRVGGTAPVPAGGLGMADRQDIL